MRLPTVPLSSLDLPPPSGRRHFMSGVEESALIALARSVSPRSVVEIGVNEGLTAAALLRDVPGIETYIGIDVFPDHVPTLAIQRREVPADPGGHAMHDPRFTLRLMPRGTFDLVPGDLPPADLVFIDGDHSADAVRHDTRLALSIIRQDGMIVWHDYHHLGTVGVAGVLEEMAAAGTAILHVEGTWLAFERL